MALLGFMRKLRSKSSGWPENPCGSNASKSGVWRSLLNSLIKLINMAWEFPASSSALVKLPMQSACWQSKTSLRGTVMKVGKKLATF